MKKHNLLICFLLSLLIVMPVSIPFLEHTGTIEAGRIMHHGRKSHSYLMVEGVTFDGTNDWLTRGGGLTGAADSKQWILSVWVNITDTTNSNHILVDEVTAVNHFDYYVQTDDKVRCQGKDDGGTFRSRVESDAVITAAAGWQHVLVAGDVANGTIQQYVDDTEMDNAGYGDRLAQNTAIDFGGGTEWWIGRSIGGASKLDADIAELYFTIGEYLDISDEANRRKFRTAGGKPANLGSDGSSPTGSQPIIYLSVRDNGSATDFATNLGSGGNFTITGSLALAATSPSD